MGEVVIGFRKAKKKRKEKNKTTQSEYKIINKGDRVVSALSGAKNCRKNDGDVHRSEVIVFEMFYC